MMGPDHEWLAGLKRGDPVIINGAGLTRGERQLAKVTGATKHYVTAARVRYRRKDGRQAGGTAYSVMTIERPTPEAIQEVREEMERRRLVALLQRVPWSNLTTGQLRRAFAATRDPADRPPAGRASDEGEQT